MRKNSTLAEMSDKDGRRNLRIYPMSLANRKSKKFYRWGPGKGPLRSLAKGGAVLFDNVDIHDLHSANKPYSVLENLSKVMCDSISVLYFMSTHRWEKYKVFIVQKGIYKHERTLEEIYTPPMMSLTNMKEDKPSNLRRYANELKANLRGMVDGRFG